MFVPLCILSFDHSSPNFFLVNFCIVTLLCMFVTCDSIGGVLTRTNKLGFQPEFLGCVQLVVAFTNLSGVPLYNTYLKHV
jgi:hypothetical protein